MNNLAPEQDTAPPPYNQQDVHNRKVSTGIVGIVLGAVGLGWIGVHKFMLGFNKAGLISLLGSILTCGIGAVVFNILSLIEGIIYLTKSDEEFYQTYMVDKKDWF